MLRNSGRPHISAIDYNEQRDGCWAKNDPVFDEYKVFYCTVEWILPFIRHNFHFGKNIFSREIYWLWYEMQGRQMAWTVKTTCNLWEHCLEQNYMPWIWWNIFPVMEIHIRLWMCRLLWFFLIKASFQVCVTFFVPLGLLEPQISDRSPPFMTIEWLQWMIFFSHSLFSLFL